MAGIYIHIPFCKKACIYCDFHFSTAFGKKDELIAAMLKEIQLKASKYPYKLDTIYFGGGTPSVLSANEIFTILNTVRRQFTISESPEITLEANPDDLSLSYLTELRSVGINRLSIGLQCFQDDILSLMNRAHKAEEATACLENAASVGFKNLSVDLIYGIPQLSDEEWKNNLATVNKFNVSHLSAYNLTVEPKTILKKKIQDGSFPNLDDDQCNRHWDILLEFTRTTGYEQYEVSNFAKNECYSLHNSNYWKNKPYIGIGPSAHSYHLDYRSWNVRSNAAYLKNIENSAVPEEKELLTNKDKFNEHLLVGLRNKWGCDVKYLQSLYAPPKWFSILENHLTAGNLELTNVGFKCTSKGLVISDTIAESLIIE